MKDRLLAQHWWAVGPRGLAAIIFGILALVWPRETVIVLIALFGAYALIDGLIAIFLAVRERENHRNWGWLLAGGIITFLFLFPAGGALALVWLIGIYAIIFGAMLLGLSWRLRQMTQHPQPAM